MCWMQKIRQRPIFRSRCGSINPWTVFSRKRRVNISEFFWWHECNLSSLSLSECWVTPSTYYVAPRLVVCSEVARDIRRIIAPENPRILWVRILGRREYLHTQDSEHYNWDVARRQPLRQKGEGSNLGVRYSWRKQAYRGVRCRVRRRQKNSNNFSVNPTSCLGKFHFAHWRCKGIPRTFQSEEDYSFATGPTYDTCCPLP